jgi:hypothetical protein
VTPIVDNRVDPRSNHEERERFERLGLGRIDVVGCVSTPGDRRRGRRGRRGRRCNGVK